MANIRSFLVTRRERYVDAFLLEFIPEPLESLVIGDSDRTCVAFALQFARRILNEALHHSFQLWSEYWRQPGPLSKVIHEQIIALLWISPQVKDLRHCCDVLFCALPTEIGVHRKTAGLRAIIAA